MTCDLLSYKRNQGVGRVLKQMSLSFWTTLRRKMKILMGILNIEIRWWKEMEAELQQDVTVPEKNRVSRADDQDDFSEDDEGGTEKEESSDECK